MYNLSLDKEQLNIYVAGLDSYIKFISARLAQGNSILSLKELLPELIKVNEECIKLDKIIDNANIKT